ncbi:MAG: glutaminase, partial [Kiloniellales bacterium]|nr:glutaminase [Kiloniellales bacterium]
FDNDEAMLRSDFERVLSEIGLQRDDVRLRESMAALESYIEKKRSRVEAEAFKIPRKTFCRAVRPNLLLIERALQGRMVIPDFIGFCEEIDELYKEVRENRSGAPADYIPKLDLQGADADSFGLSFCTVDGQRYSQGDADRFFSIQSTCKPVNYCLALEEHGSDFVHRYIGHEPSGVSFNELALNKSNQPHNPMINAGAIMSSALIGLTKKKELRSRNESKGLGSDAFGLRGWSGQRFDYVIERWRALCGGEAPRFSTSVFLSERETADRNFALAYFMREKNAFPQEADLHDVLEFYLQCCSIELNCEMMSLVAATFASGGICPVTGERVFKTETVRSCLSLMSSCGMYDYSGEFAYCVGLPAKSGVSGAIMVVVPNVLGFCIWSPRLDALGNSVRGIDFCRRFVQRFNFHNFDDLTGRSQKKDPRLDPIQVKARQVNEMILAASKGDLGAIQDQMHRGSDLSCRDYDLRTPLHLAAAENQAHVVRFFIEEAGSHSQGFSVNPVDRWGGTPLDDAYRQGHSEIVSLLEEAGACRGAAVRTSTRRNGSAPASKLQLVTSVKTGELIWAASLGDLHSIRRLVAQGVPLEAADYDYRTALHLAAAEGHDEIVRFFLAHGVSVNPRDRWDNTPLDEAIRHKRENVASLLAENGGKEARRSRGCKAGKAA